ncbi:MAG: DUF4430 domain-containing protein [Clostridia bacterium]|nr:DUF4430 domain-containing protein [Clostridia bacterium]
MRKFLVFICVLCLFTGCTAQKGDIWQNATYKEDKTFGAGEKVLYVEVKALENSVTFTVNTDKDNVGDALLEHNLIKGEDGVYGLYIKEVNGIRADYDEDKAYWSFTKNGESMMTGVSGTEFETGDKFELVYTK